MIHQMASCHGGGFNFMTVKGWVLIQGMVLIIIYRRCSLKLLFFQASACTVDFIHGIKKVIM